MRFLSVEILLYDGSSLEKMIIVPTMVISNRMGSRSKAVDAVKKNGGTLAEGLRKKPRDLLWDKLGMVLLARHVPTDVTRKCLAQSRTPIGF
jgi:hypothetical protein